MDQKADPEKPKTWPRFVLRVDHHMCNYLTSGKRTRLAILSSSLKVWIFLKVCTPGSILVCSYLKLSCNCSDKKAPLKVWMHYYFITQ